MAFFNLGGQLFNVEYLVAFCENGHVYRHKANRIKLANFTKEKFHKVCQNLKTGQICPMMVSDIVCIVYEEQENKLTFPINAIIAQKFIMEIRPHDEQTIIVMDLGNHNIKIYANKPINFFQNLLHLRVASIDSVGIDNEELENAKKIIAKKGWKLLDINFQLNQGAILDVLCNEGHPVRVLACQLSKDSGFKGLIHLCKECHANLITLVHKKANGPDINVMGDEEVIRLLIEAMDMIQSRGDVYIGSCLHPSGGIHNSGRPSHILCVKAKCARGHEYVVPIGYLFHPKPNQICNKCPTCCHEKGRKNPHRGYHFHFKPENKLISIIQQ